MRKLLVSFLTALALLSSAPAQAFVGTAAAAAQQMQPTTVVNLWANQVVANGGSVSAPRKAVYLTYITALWTSGAWYALSDQWLLVAENSQSALTSIKQRRLATVIAAPSFTIDRGYAFNGTTQAIDTGLIPTTMGGPQTFTSQSIDVYERANVTTNSNSGGGTVSNNGSQIRACSGTTRMTASLSSALVNLTLLSTSSLGMTSASRNDATSTPSLNGYRNAVAVTPVAAASSGTTLSTVSIYIGATNASNTVSGPRAATVGYMGVWAFLSSTLMTAVYNAVQAYMTSAGANV